AHRESRGFSRHGADAGPFVCFLRHEHRLESQGFPREVTSWYVADNKFFYTNRELIDSSSWVRRIASPIRWATDKTLILLQPLASGPRGIVLVTINSSKGHSAIRCIAGPDSTGCVQHPRIFLAPSFFKASAAIVSVPAVSTIS